MIKGKGPLKKEEDTIPPDFCLIRSIQKLLTVILPIQFSQKP